MTREILAGLDFTAPAVDLIDEVVDRLSARWADAHPGQAMPDDTFTRICAQADRLVIGRLR